MDVDRINGITKEILDAAFKIHTALGPGLLESAYEKCLAYELRKRGLSVRTQVPIPIRYEDLIIDPGFRADMLVVECVLVELKSVRQTTVIHESQLLTHLKLGHFKVGLLLNFHVLHFVDGITRMVNRL